MSAARKSSIVRHSLAVLLIYLPSVARADDSKAEIVLGNRVAQCIPHTNGYSAQAGGGVVSVEQPSPDTVIVTMSGAAAARSNPLKESQAVLSFELNQEFQILFHDAKNAQLRLEARAIGSLRSGDRHHGCSKWTGTVAQDLGSAVVYADTSPILAASVEPHVVACGQGICVNCKSGPLCAQIFPGCYSLHGTFAVRALRSKSILPCAAVSADFGPKSLGSSWIDCNDPFESVSKDDFGFQIKLRLISE